MVLAVVVGGGGGIVLEVVGDGVGGGAAAAHCMPRLSLVIKGVGDGVGIGAASAQSIPRLSLVWLLWFGVICDADRGVGAVSCDSSVVDLIAALKTSLRSRGICGKSLLVW